MTEDAGAEFKDRVNKLRQNPSNQICFDCNNKSPTWSLGVHLTFVRSCTLDSFTEADAKRMEAGGNAAARAYFKQHGGMHRLVSSPHVRVLRLRLYSSASATPPLVVAIWWHACLGNAVNDLKNKYGTPAARKYKDIISKAVDSLGRKESEASLGSPLGKLWAILLACRCYNSPWASKGHKHVDAVRDEMVAGKVFALQRLGFDVDAINTVHFSNHTGYGLAAGEKVDSVQVSKVIGGLRENGLLDYTVLLIGYIGDNGRLYVPPEHVPVYRDKLIGLADLLLPNAFEAESLSGIPITTLDDAWRVLKWFHEERGVPEAHQCLLRSSPVDGLGLFAVAPTLMHHSFWSPSAASSFHALDRLALPFLHVSPLPQVGQTASPFGYTVDRLDSNFTGSGDLFSALVVGARVRTGDLQVAVGQALSSVHAVLQHTLKAGHAVAEAAALPLGDMSRAARSKAMELRLIECQDLLVKPPQWNVSGSAVQSLL
eukprot:gene3487-661_t